jgi:phage head maturation protease
MCRRLCLWGTMTEPTEQDTERREQLGQYAVKLLEENEKTATVAGYGVIFGGQDLEGEFFTKSTDFMLDLVPTKLVLYDHTMQPEVQDVLGAVKASDVRLDDMGIWIQAQLDRSKAYVEAVLELIKQGAIGISSGAVSHLVRRDNTGAILRWPIVEFSLTATPAEPRTLGVSVIKSLANVQPELKALLETAQESGNAEQVGGDQAASEQELNMSENEQAAAPQVDVAQIAQAAADAAVAQAMKAFEARLAEQQPAERPDNDPGIKQVNVIADSSDWKYDNYPAGDIAATLEFVSKAKRVTPRQLNPDMVKALARRLESSEANDEMELTGAGGRPYKTAGSLKMAKTAMKRAGIKADETNFSTNASYGDEWIGVAYSGQLWESVRDNSGVVQRVPTFEFPAGAESLVIPLESTDPIWYLVSQAGDPSNNLSHFTLTVPVKALGTGNKTMTLGKLGTATLYTGEMVEDAVLPFANQLRAQIAISGSEYLESALIDGDNATATTTNVNDIAGTPASTDYFLIWDGFRVSPLVTTTANSRDGGVLTSADFIETVKLMGVSGKVGYNRNAVSFILPPPTHWKALELADIKTRDVFANPTLENGNLTRIWGYEVLVSYNYNKPSLVNTGYEYKENTSGKIDVDTASNNTKGSLLAVRWDHWRMGFRRRMVTEVERIPRADGWEITTLMRAGLAQRDTEASAITYNLTV